MDRLFELAANTTSPLLAISVLAIVFGLDPCAMLTNIAAMGYLGKDIDNKRLIFAKGLLYALGRTLTFGLLGSAMITLLRQGENIDAVEHFMSQNGELMLIPLMIITGLLLCLADFIPGLQISINANKVAQQARFTSWGAFWMGVLLSFGFCPTNAMIFFGMVSPLCATNGSYIHPFIFAIITALPVVILAWILAFSLKNINKFYTKAKSFSKWIRWIVGIIFIAIGVYFAIEHFTGDCCHQHSGCDTEQCEHNHNDDTHHNCEHHHE